MFKEYLKKRRIKKHKKWVANFGKIHDFREKSWGWSLSMQGECKDGYVDCMGHGQGIKKNDVIFLRTKALPNGRYCLVTNFEYLSNPSDMFRMTYYFLGATAQDLLKNREISGANKRTLSSYGISPGENPNKTPFGFNNLGQRNI